MRIKLKEKMQHVEHMSSNQVRYFYNIIFKTNLYNGN
jgi:hypothetical protein